MANVKGTRKILDKTEIKTGPGVLVSDDLKVRYQVKEAAFTANRVLGRLKFAVYFSGKLSRQHISVCA